MHAIQLIGPRLRRNPVQQLRDERERRRRLYEDVNATLNAVDRALKPTGLEQTGSCCAHCRTPITVKTMTCPGCGFDFTHGRRRNATRNARNACAGMPVEHHPSGAILSIT